MTHLTLGTLLRYLGKSEIQTFAGIQQIWKKMQTKCILSYQFLSLCAYNCILSVLMCFYQNPVIIAEYHVNC